MLARMMPILLTSMWALAIGACASAQSADDGVPLPAVSTMKPFVVQERAAPKDRRGVEQPRLDGARSGEGLTQKQIQKVVTKNMARIRTCYEMGLQAEPDAAGKITLHWSIDGKGRVTSVDGSDSTIGSRAIDACVVELVKTFVFQKPKGGGAVKVTYPFIFDVDDDNFSTGAANKL